VEVIIIYKLKSSTDWGLMALSAE